MLQLEPKSPFDLCVNLGNDVPDTEVRTALTEGMMGFVHSFTTGSGVDGPGVRVVVWTTGCMWRCQYCHNPDAWGMRNGMLVAGAKAMGIHTAIETNGYLGLELTEPDLDKLDLVLLGIKAWDPDRHRMLTGRDNGATLEFARRLAARAIPVWIRFVLVPGSTDDAEDIGHIAQFAATLGNVQRVEVLPLHQMGRCKWNELGIRYSLEHTPPPTAEACEDACEIFRAAGLNSN